MVTVARHLGDRPRTTGVDVVGWGLCIAVIGFFAAMIVLGFTGSTAAFWFLLIVGCAVGSIVTVVGLLALGVSIGRR